jgi:hypothetical protein
VLGFFCLIGPWFWAKLRQQTITLAKTIKVDTHGLTPLLFFQFLIDPKIVITHPLKLMSISKHV